MIPVTAKAAIPSTNCVSESALHQYEDVEMTVQKTGLVRRKSWPDLCDVKWFVTDRSETQRSNLGANHSLIAETAAHYRHLSNLLTWTLCFSKTILSSVGGSHINAQMPETTWCV